MPNPAGIITVALDFDGTLVGKYGEGPIAWRRGAREFIGAAAMAGIHLVLHTCRATVRPELDPAWAADEFWMAGVVPVDLEIAWRLYEEVRAFLLGEGVWHLVEVWTRPGKPFADLYVDDLAAAPNWATLARELGVNLANGAQAGSPGPQGMGGPQSAGPIASPLGAVGSTAAGPAAGP